jgi:hypothetical protein
MKLKQLLGHFQGNQQMTYGATTSSRQTHQNQEQHRVCYPPFHSHKSCNKNCTINSAPHKMSPRKQTNPRKKPNKEILTSLSYLHRPDFSRLSNNTRKPHENY